MGNTHSCPLSEDIVVHDENYNGEYADAYEKAGVAIDEIIVKYVQILTDLVCGKEVSVTDGNNLPVAGVTGYLYDIPKVHTYTGLSGKAADNLLAFAELVNTLLGNCASEIMLERKNTMNRFIEDIDSADKEIY